MEVSCIVLAGGKSVRLGRNKIIENLGGKMLLERVLDTLSLFKGEIILVTSAHSALPEVAGYPRVRVVQDIYPNKGSLGGIYSGIVSSKTFYNLLVACDMPFLSFNLLRYMLEIAPDYDLVAFREGQHFEPLHAIYSKNCIPPLEKLLERESVRIIEILHYVNTRFLTLKEIEGFEHGHLSFFNINYENDLQKAVEIIKNELPQLSSIKVPS